MAAGIELLDCAIAFGAARLITFIGGPSVGGAGAIVGKSISEPVCAYVDLMSCFYSWAGALFGGRSHEMCLFIGALARRSFRRALRRSRGALCEARIARRRGALLVVVAVVCCRDGCFARSITHLPNMAGGDRARSRTFLVWQAGIALDLVCASLDECGLWEMRACIHRTGGAALQVAIDDDEANH